MELEENVKEDGSDESRVRNINPEFEAVAALFGEAGILDPDSYNSLRNRKRYSLFEADSS